MNTPTPDAGHDVGLTDVMLAMDVVDTLRHEQQMVAHALNAEAREQALIERVRRAYEAQGLDVSEAMIVEGVAALKARQYAYEPPPPGLRTALLRGWVNRTRIGGGLLVVLILAAIIGVGWWGFVEWPQQRALGQQAAALNRDIQAASATLTELEQQRARLARALDARAGETPGGPVANVRATLIDGARRDLADADAALMRAARLAQLPSVDADNVGARGATAGDLLGRQQAALAEAGAAITSGLERVDMLDGLAELPARLGTLRDEAQALAVEPAVDQRIDALYSDGVAALRRGDVDGASAAVTALRDLAERLAPAWEVRVVSRPGELSGVIREPRDNPRASNYYLIVEALDSKNQPVAVDIRSEEDGSTRSVTRWGVRVSEQTFARVRDDKADDGIIQRDRVGAKPRGYLDIDYDIPVEGGFINRWEQP